MAAALLLASIVPHFVVAAPPLPDGWLVRAEDDTRVYFLDQGMKRWVNSPETLHAQGMDQEAIHPVSASELASVPEGERLTAESVVILPADEGVLPDLSPLPPRDLRIATVDGRKVIRFTAKFWNQGGGPLELVTNGETVQHILRTDGTERRRVVGDFVWHAAHFHYHYSDFADYVIEPARLPPGVTVQTVTQKTTFCMRDNEQVSTEPPNSAPNAVFTMCNQYRQGVSVGWADVYRYTLPDQFIDVNDLTPGTYRLSFDIDPRGHFVEGNTENNRSSAIIELDLGKDVLNVIASGSTFDGARNFYQEGMLVRGDEKPGVYVIHNNRKFPLRTAEMFESRGFSWDDIYWFPQSVVDAIPNAPIRAVGGTAIYAVNANGFRRHVLNPTVFGSYGWEPEDVYELGADELAGYPETDLVAREGVDRVFSLATSQAVGTRASLSDAGRDPLSVHVVNETDLLAYATKTVATGLNVPWDIAFLPDGDMLVTERPGTLRRIGAHPSAFAIPAVAGAGEGGLMGIALHPDFATNGLVYLYYTTTDPNRNRIARFQLSENSLVLDAVILDGIPSAIYHDGGQIAFGPDGMLYVTTGDANDASSAQDLSSLAGKTLRITPDGGIPSDNPFGNAVWSYGHRNPQGIAWDDFGHAWATEHGRSGASSGYDELNLIAKGGNYGWPDSQGSTVAAGTIGPVRQSGATTTWAPSGIAYASGTLFYAGLLGESLYAADVDGGGKVTGFRQYFKGTYGRLRGVVLGPDGFLYVTTSNRDGRGTIVAEDDRIIRVAPGFLQ